MDLCKLHSQTPWTGRKTARPRKISKITFNSPDRILSNCCEARLHRATFQFRFALAHSSKPLDSFARVRSKIINTFVYGFYRQEPVHLNLFAYICLVLSFPTYFHGFFLLFTLYLSRKHTTQTVNFGSLSFVAKKKIKKFKSADVVWIGFHWAITPEYHLNCEKFWLFINVHWKLENSIIFSHT